MTVEKINGAQPSSAIQMPDAPQEEKNTVQQSGGSSKDVVTALSILAALGAAGVAIYKHKNAKKMVEEAEAAAKKKIEEAEQKAKQAEEETAQKIKEAVENVQKEYENNAKKVDNNNIPESSSAPKKNRKNAGNKEKETVKQKRLEGGISDKNLKKVDVNFLKQVRESQNGIIVIPKSTKLADFFKKIKNSIKIKPKTKTETEQKASRLNNFGAKISETTKKTKGFIGTQWNKFLGLFKHKKAEAPILRATEEGEKIKQNIKNQLSGKPDYEKLANELVKEPHTQAEHDRLQALYSTLATREPNTENILKGIKMPDVTKIAEKDLITEYNALEKSVKYLPVSDSTAQRYLEIKGELLNHRGYKIMPDGKIQKSVPEAKVINQDSPDSLSDIELLIEYNLLRKQVKKLPVMADESQRFLQIQGELINHRQYKLLPDGRVKKARKKSLSFIEKARRFFS